MLTINGATRVRSTYGFARSKSSEITSMPGGWQWTSRKWNGLRDCLRRIIRRMTGDKRSSMPATLGGNPLITNENGLSGWRTTRVGQNSTAKTRAKIIDCRTVPRDRHSGARVPRSFSAPRRSAAVVSKFCRRDSNLTVKINSSHRHFLRYYTLTTIMIGQEVTYLRICTVITYLRTLNYVNIIKGKFNKSLKMKILLSESILTGEKRKH